MRDVINITPNPGFLEVNRTYNLIYYNLNTMMVYSRQRFMPIAITITLRNFLSLDKNELQGEIINLNLTSQFKITFFLMFDIFM